MDASTTSSPTPPPVAPAAITRPQEPRSQPSGTNAAERNATTADDNGRYRVMLDIDENSKRVVTTFVDPDTNEVIDQLPSKKMLRIAAAIREMLGALVDTQA